MSKIQRKKKKSSAADLSGAREKILSVARHLIAENGYKATSTRDIAKKSGLNISLISYYFGGKEGLYKTIIKEHADRTQADLEKIIQNFSQKEFTLDLLSKEIRSIIRIFVEMRLENEDISKIFMQERIQRMPFIREIYENMVKTTGEKIYNLILTGQKKGFVKSFVHPQVVFSLMIESIFGYFSVHDCHLSIMKDSYQFPRDKEKFIELVAKVFLEGIVS